MAKRQQSFTIHLRNALVVDPPRGTAVAMPRDVEEALAQAHVRQSNEAAGDRAARMLADEVMRLRGVVYQVVPDASRLNWRAPSATSSQWLGLEPLREIQVSARRTMRRELDRVLRRRPTKKRRR